MSSLWMVRIATEPEFLVDWAESSAINKGAQTNHHQSCCGRSKYEVLRQ